ncbi:MAG: TatD family hydrolase [Chitinophagales bacterium]|nr:TatD family hydrolase [Chitinophagales bacterium]
MARLIDTHCHGYDTELYTKIPDWIVLAQKAGVEKVFLPNIDLNSFGKMWAIKEKYPDFLECMLGIHPCYVSQETEPLKTWLLAQLECYKNQIIAIGEIGLDYHWDTTYVTQQKEMFHFQLDLALTHDFSVNIHSRKANHELLPILKNYANKGLKGVLHCFSGSIEEAKEATGFGFSLGIGGVVTYKNTNLREILKEIPLEFIVLETDAPYLSPVPHRGQTNHSAYLTYIAQTLSEVYQLNVAEIGEITSNNAIRLYSLK